MCTRERIVKCVFHILKSTVRNENFQCIFKIKTLRYFDALIEEKQ